MLEACNKYIHIPKTNMLANRIMPPRQPIMPKRIPYYASENIKKLKIVKDGKGRKWTPDGSSELSDQGKMPFNNFLVELENKIAQK